MFGEDARGLMLSAELREAKRGGESQEGRREGRGPVPPRPPCPLPGPSRLAFSFLLVTGSHGAVLDMFYPLSPAKQPYSINLWSFPVAGSLPVNPAPFPRWAYPPPSHSSRVALCSPRRGVAEVCWDPPGLSSWRAASRAHPLLCQLAMSTSPGSHPAGDKTLAHPEFFSQGPALNDTSAPQRTMTLAMTQREAEV